jgi:hypothetical protein
MTIKMSIAGKRAALSKIEPFATSTDQNIVRIYKPKYDKLKKELDELLLKHPEYATPSSSRNRANGKVANPRRTLAAKQAWITMNKQKLEKTEDPLEREQLHAAIERIEDDIENLRQLFPGIDTPLSGGGETLVDRDAMEQLYMRFEADFAAEFDRIMMSRPHEEPAEAGDPEQPIEQPIEEPLMIGLLPKPGDEPAKDGEIVGDVDPSTLKLIEPPVDQPEPKQNRKQQRRNQRRAA